jgi:glycosyltransferase involved in cell wall biosynthesis
LTSSTFNVVYVGSLSVNKGVPLLIDAFRRLTHGDLRLVLVGSWGTRGMRLFVENACSLDPRITARLGDPLPDQLQASVYVHPSYEEGSPYAPAEALACGVPLIVSEDSAMKGHRIGLRSCTTVPTGDLTALTEAIEASYRGGLPL